MSPANLFGVEGAETLYDDPAEAYELQIEPWADEHDRRPRVIEEWASRYATDSMPSAEDVVEWLATTYAEGDMAPDDDGATAEGIEASAKVRAAAEALVEAAAAQVTYRWASDLVAAHLVTWDDDGDPLIDGEPLYGEPRPRPRGCSFCGSRRWAPTISVGRRVRQCADCGHVGTTPAEASRG